MILKRLILGLLTLVVVVQTAFSLIDSWSQPQIQSRLELYQTNLLLRANQWQGFPQPEATPTSPSTVQTAILGENPLVEAEKQYKDAREKATQNLEKVRSQLTNFSSPQNSNAPSFSIPGLRLSPDVQRQKLLLSQQSLSRLMAELDLRIGVLQAAQSQIPQAVKSWQLVAQQTYDNNDPQLSSVAETLIGLWSQPSNINLQAKSRIQKSLDGWFRDRALVQLYQLENRSEELTALKTQEQAIAQQALIKLILVGTIPALTLMIGIGFIIFLVIQWFSKGKESLLKRNTDLVWETPWTWETIWQVFIAGFFLMKDLLLPILVGISLAFLPVNPANFSSRQQAIFSFVTYILFSLGTIGVLYLSIRSFFPLPKEWFNVKGQGSWWKWGIGGYFVAVPAVLFISVINQQLWQGQGGSNPLLPIALESRDGVALVVFFITAAVAAPLFEEFLFRGFLLPSLTRYFPVGGAVVLSGFIFALVHLSLSEVLPLTVLGIILGGVYVRSRNLLASMLLHSLWNSGTLLSLYILGSGSS